MSQLALAAAWRTLKKRAHSLRLPQMYTFSADDANKSAFFLTFAAQVHPRTDMERISSLLSLTSFLILLPLFAQAQDIPASPLPLAGEPALVAQPDPADTEAALLPSDAPAIVPAGEISFGYLSYDEALKAMPQYEAAQEQIAQLRAATEAELKHNQEAFSKAYYEYVEGQQTFEPYILSKRQKELAQQLADNEDFRTQSLALLAQKETEVMEPLRQQLEDIIHRIGMEHNYAFILNTDNNAFPFLNGAIGTDITADVVAAF